MPGIEIALMLVVESVLRPILPRNAHEGQHINATHGNGN